jgi:hypothetical protein
MVLPVNMVEAVACVRAPSTVADVDAVARWLDDRIAASVQVRDRLLADARPADAAERLADARLRSPADRETGTGLLGAVRYEERVLDDPERGGGVCYDGHAVQRLYGDALARRDGAAERAGTSDRLDRLAVVFLDRALATWGDHDGRWHKRVSVLGRPAVVSVPGLYEAAAKPDAYYQAKQAAAVASGEVPPREVLESAVDGDFLVEDDPRTTDCLKGIALQAVDYLQTGEPFCDDPDCRLFNAHRQPALLRAQCEGEDFCEEHDRLYG